MNKIQMVIVQILAAVLLILLGAIIFNSGYPNLAVAVVLTPLILSVFFVLRNKK